MDIELVKSKIYAIKSITPTIDDFLLKGFDIEYASQISAEYVIELNQKLIFDSKTTIIDFFDKNVRLNLSFFVFQLSEQEDYEDFIVIGSRDSDLLIVIKETNEIAVFDQYTSNIILYIAKDFKMLLDLLPVLISYDKVGFLGEEYSTDLKKNTLKNIKVILKNNKYYSTFEQSICY